MVDNDASDLHLSAGSPPALRINGSIRRIKSDDLTDRDCHQIAYSILNERQKKRFETDREIDLAKIRKAADVGADESGDVILHAHVHMDGAPMAVVMVYSLCKQVDTARSGAHRLRR